MWKAFKQLKMRDWIFIVLSLVLIVGQVWLEITMPDYMKRITELVVTPGSRMSEIWVQGGWMLACAAGSLVFSVIAGYFVAQVAANLGKNLRAALFDKVQNFSMDEINRFSTASLITRSTNDVTQVQMLIAMGLQVMVKAPVLAVWAIIKIAGKSWQWTAATGAAVGVMLVMILVIVLLVMPKFKRIQGYTDNLNRLTRENLTGVRVVRAYNAEGYQEEKFETANQELMRTQLFTMRAMSFMMPGMNFLMNGLNLAIFWIGAVLINKAAIAERVNLFGDLTIFSSYAMMIVMSFVMLTMIFVMMPRSLVSARRISEVLGTEATIADGPGVGDAAGGAGEVEFRNVSFRYPDAEEEVISDVSFSAHRGETVAFIGSTGSGKSTLINLVPRFYDATEGEILVDGVDVRQYRMEELHNKIGYVPQKAVMFSGSVESNVAFGENGKTPPSEEEIMQAIEVAQGAEFVRKMGGLDASVAQGGTNISGGQKQRLAIARAVCRNPEIYIFDDSFSALDYKTDKVLRGALKKKTKDATSLIVAQRIGTIIDADKILVLDDGKVVGMGTHKELLRDCSVYREIAYSQLSKEELEK